MRPQPLTLPGPHPSSAQGLLQLLLWASLAACASTLLLAITNHLSQNLAPIPLLWVVPLAIYLTTFILTFESDRIYRRWIVLPCLAPALGGMAYLIWDPGDVPLQWLIAVFATGLFLCCMMCHGELAHRKPPAQHLTLFYLMVSLGGALGGLFVALIAPRVFRTYLELPLGLLACGLLAIIVLWNVAIPRLGAWPLRMALVIGACVLAGYMGRREHLWRQDSILIDRNFYGVLSVREDPEDEPPDRTLVHGSITFGAQVLDSKLRDEPTTYYGANSGVGRAIKALEEKGPIRVGIIGLGAERAHRLWPGGRCLPLL